MMRSRSWRRGKQKFDVEPVKSEEEGLADVLRG